MELAKKSAEQNFTLAQHLLGEIYYYDERADQSYEKALKWFEIAANQNHTTAIYNLASIYSHGEGVIQENKEEAFRLMLKAAKQNFHLAQFQLAEMYYYGEGTLQNIDEAYQMV